MCSQYLDKLAKEAQLVEKYRSSLYNGEVINTGEKRLVLHQLTRGQLGEQGRGRRRRQARILCRHSRSGSQSLPIKVHAGEITNAAGEKFTTVVQIGIGGSDLRPPCHVSCTGELGKEKRYIQDGSKIHQQRRPG